MSEDFPASVWLRVEEIFAGHGGSRPGLVIVHEWQDKTDAVEYVRAASTRKDVRS